VDEGLQLDVLLLEPLHLLEEGLAIELEGVLLLLDLFELLARPLALGAALHEARR